MRWVDHQALSAFAAAIYVAAGAPAEHGAIVARHQVGANLAGHDSHGIRLLPAYVGAIERGHLVPTARPRVIAETSTTLFVSGGWGFGQVVSEWTMAACVERARLAKVCVGVVREQAHVGRLAGYTLIAARAGMIGMMLCDSGRAPKQVAPFGGRAARLGTNPISIAIPADLDAPLVIDMATSAAAFGKIELARARGIPVPLGWLIDRAGRPSTDPSALAAGGAMLPLGGSEGYKGYALSVAVETLAALLPGLGFGLDPEGRHNDGAFMLVIDPTAFRPLEDFQADVAAFVGYLKATPPAAGFSEVLYPGEPEYRAEQERRGTGIPVDDPTWRQLMAVASRYGVTFPGPLRASCLQR
jgi:uncharacterized oxidoreductase